MTARERRPRWPIAAALLVVVAGGAVALTRGGAVADPPKWAAAIESWGAVAVGTEMDAATGWPKRIRRTVDDAEMVLIPAGPFQMGAVPGDEDAEDDELPRHAVTLTKAYYLDVHEVTNGQFERFVAATGHKTTAETDGRGYRLKADGTGAEQPKDATWRSPSPGGGRPSDFAKHPVVLVSWDDASAYLRWANAGRAEGFALPSEAQFERAIRGGREGDAYPWGARLPAPNDAGNYAGDEVKRAYPKWGYEVMTGHDDPYPLTAPVASFAANAYRAHDLAGNVWEWCGDWYAKDYYATSPGRDPTGPVSGSSRVLRGGGWLDVTRDARAGYRNDDAPTGASGTAGFRCARSLP